MKLLLKTICLTSCLASVTTTNAVEDLVISKKANRLQIVQPYASAKKLKTQKKKPLKTKKSLKGVDQAAGFDDPSNMTFFTNYVKAAARYAFDKANSADKIKYFTSGTAGKLKDPNGKTKNKINQVTANFMPVMQLGNYSREILSFMGVTYNPKTPAKPITFPTIIPGINDLAGLDSRVKSLKDAGYQTSSQVNTAITTALTPVGGRLNALEAQSFSSIRATMPAANGTVPESDTLFSGQTIPVSQFTPQMLYTWMYYTTLNILSSHGINLQNASLTFVPGTGGLVGPAISAPYGGLFFDDGTNNYTLQQGLYYP